MSKRLRQAYMTGPTHVFMMILSAKSPIDAINKVKYLEKINRYDRDLAQQIVAGKTVINEKKVKQHLELEHLSSLHAAKKSENDALISQEQQRKKMLGDIRKEKASYEAMVKELERSQKELVSMIRLLEKKRKKAREHISTKSVASFEKKKGALPWPVEGPVITKFGKVIHPEYQTVIMNNGVDIEAEKGEPVHCIAMGTVIHTGWLRGLGKMVIVDHVGGYLTIYAHLETIDVNVDQTVTADTILGKVGETGSLGGTRMHFEIRKSSEALNPVDWLEKK
jgi:septal ring factor EnvC (AmiA/AmiB activator)